MTPDATTPMRCNSDLGHTEDVPIPGKPPVQEGVTRFSEYELDQPLSPAAKNHLEDPNFVITVISLFIAVVSLILAYQSNSTAAKFTASGSRMQFLKGIYDGYTDFSKNRVENWALTHLFIVPGNDGDTIQYDQSVTAIRLALAKETPEKLREYELQEEGLVTLILTKYEQGLYEWEEAKRINDQWAADFLETEVVGYFRGSVIRNPRLLFYWERVKSLFSDKLRKDVAEHLPKDRLLAVDRIGPFRTQPLLTYPEAIRSLNDDFLSSYGKTKRKFLSEGAGMIMAVGDELVLRSKQQLHRKRCIPDEYHILKSFGHLPLGLYAKLKVQLGDAETVPLAADLLDELLVTQHRIEDAVASIEKCNLNEAQAKRQNGILNLCSELVSSMRKTKSIHSKDVDTFRDQVMPLVMTNTSEAAVAQLSSMKVIIDEWRKSLSDIDWDRLSIVVCGSAPARRDNLAVMLFQRAFDLSATSDRLIYVESIFDEQRAIDFVATRLLDDSVSKGLFSESARMQRDILGDAAREWIMKSFVETVRSNERTE